jgi:hypothetical protein
MSHKPLLKSKKLECSTLLCPENFQANMLPNMASDSLREEVQSLLASTHFASNKFALLLQSIH